MFYQWKKVIIVVTLSYWLTLCHRWTKLQFYFRSFLFWRFKLGASLSGWMNEWIFIEMQMAECDKVEGRLLQPKLPNMLVPLPGSLARYPNYVRMSGAFKTLCIWLVECSLPHNFFLTPELSIELLDLLVFGLSEWKKIYFSQNQLIKCECCILYYSNVFENGEKGIFFWKMWIFVPIQCSAKKFCYLAIFFKEPLTV